MAQDNWSYADLVKAAYERKLFLPNIQRGVVWDEDDIRTLIDSILRGYPIGAIFLWRTKLRDIEFRSFPVSYNASDYLPHLDKPADQDEVTLVLDGQQRIQSLLVALRGRYDGKRCCLKLASPKENLKNPDELAYEIEFLTEPELLERRKKDASWRTLSDIYYHADDVKKSVGLQGNDDGNGESLIDSLRESFDVLAKTIEVGPERPLNEVVNIFIRVNKAGEPLKAADLIMALVKTEWSTAGEMFERLARELNFDVDSTFVLRWALTFLRQGIDLRDISKVSAYAEEMRDNFGEISQIAKDAVEFAKEAVEKRQGLIGTAGFAIIPLLHYARSRESWTTERNQRRIRYWLYWSNLIGRFSFRGINKVPIAIETIDSNTSGEFPVEAIIAALCDRYPHVQPRVDLRTPAGVFEVAKHNAGAILKIYQRKRIADIGSTTSYHIDHIFPQAGLMERGFSPEQISDIGNLRLYLGILNERKNAQDPQQHIEAKSEGELKLEFGIGDRDLFNYERYKEFIQQRREIVLKSVSDYLAYV